MKKLIMAISGLCLAFTANAKTYEEPIFLDGIMENVYIELIEQHNTLGITPYVELSNNEWTRGLVDISTSNVCKGLEETITSVV